MIETNLKNKEKIWKALSATQFFIGLILAVLALVLFYTNGPKAGINTLGLNISAINIFYTSLFALLLNKYNLILQIILVLLIQVIFVIITHGYYYIP